MRTTTSLQRIIPSIQLRLADRHLLLRLIDSGIVAGSVLVAMMMWTFFSPYPQDRFTLQFALENSYWFAVWVGAWLILSRTLDFYERTLRRQSWELVRSILIIELEFFLLYLLVFFFSPRDILPRLFVLYFEAVCGAGLVAWYVWIYPRLDWSSTATRVVILGESNAIETLLRAIREHVPDVYDVVAYDNPTHFTHIDLVGNTLAHWLKARHVQELIITQVDLLTPSFVEDAIACYQHGITIVPMTHFYERITGRIPVEYIERDWMFVLPLGTSPLFDPYSLLRRLVDVLLGLVGLGIFALMLPLLALTIYLDSRGSIFYTQKRCGKGGNNYTLYKLRTMIPHAESQSGAVFATPNDPRITRVGRFLRRSRLDELPQLWNVVRGEMSLIGPRPERPEHVERLASHIPYYRTRLMVRPGLTGWAQVQYSYGMTDEDAQTKLEYDLYYIRNVSFLLDLNIVLKTIGIILRLGGQ